MSKKSAIVDSALDENSEDQSALVPLTHEPPTILPAIVLDDLVPFPGPVVPVLLESQARRDAALHAKSNNGYFMLVNRRVSDDEGLQIRPG